MYYQLCIKDKRGKVINIAITARHIIITSVRHGSVTCVTPENIESFFRYTRYRNRPNKFLKFRYFLLSGLFGTPGAGTNSFFLIFYSLSLFQ